MYLTGIYTCYPADQNDFLNIQYNCYVKRFVLHTLRRDLEITNFSNSFLNYFYVNYVIATKLLDIICALIVIVITKYELSCTKITLAIRLLIDLRDGKGRGQTLKQTWL